MMTTHESSGLTRALDGDPGGKPLVTLLWLNFNSMKNLPLIKESLDSMLGQGYTNFETLLIDNGSTDGSWEAVKEHAGQVALQGQRVAFIETGRNLGYTGGFDFGYMRMNPSTKHVAVVSDDAVLSPDYLDCLVSALEGDGTIGAVQGVVATLDGERVDSAGALIDKLMIPHHIRRGQPIGSVGEPSDVSFVEGTCPVYRVDALMKVMGPHLFYPPGFFQYLEDNLNGLLLWNAGYRCVTLPRVVARHKREAGGGGQLRTYCLWRNRTALVKLTDSRLKPLEYAFGAASLIYMLSSGQGDKARMLVKGMWDGHALAARMRRGGYTVSLAKVPMYRLGAEYVSVLIGKSRGRGRLDEMDL